MQIKVHRPNSNQKWTENINEKKKPKNVLYYDRQTFLSENISIIF